MAKFTKEEIMEVLKPLTLIGSELMDVDFPSNWKVPDDYTLERIEVNGVPIERLIPKRIGSDLVIFHLHGGAYAFKYMDAYRDCALQYSKAAGGAEVISLDYDCAPNHVFPCALEESVQIYQWMLAQGMDAKKIVIVGDSAGGNLTMVTTMYLRDNKLPMPKALITISPWVTLESNFASMERNKENDLVLGVEMPGIHEQVLRPSYARGADLKTPYLSPLYGEFHEFPPMLIQFGNHEMLFDSIVEAIEKIREAGVDATVTIYDGMFHDFQLLVPMLDESEAAWNEIAGFFQKIK